MNVKSYDVVFQKVFLAYDVRRLASSPAEPQPSCCYSPVAGWTGGESKLNTGIGVTSSFINNISMPPSHAHTGRHDDRSFETIYRDIVTELSQPYGTYINIRWYTLTNNINIHTCIPGAAVGFDGLKRAVFTKKMDRFVAWLKLMTRKRILIQCKSESIQIYIYLKLTNSKFENR